MKTENSIDIVITWVDGNDPEWRSEKNKTRYGKEQLSETDDREETGSAELKTARLG